MAFLGIIKLAGAQVNLTQATNTISNATALKVLNMGANAVVTVLDTVGTVLGNTTILASDTMILVKQPTDTVNCSTNTVLVTPVAKVY